MRVHALIVLLGTLCPERTPKSLLWLPPRRNAKHVLLSTCPNGRTSQPGIHPMRGGFCGARDAGERIPTGPSRRRSAAEWQVSVISARGQISTAPLTNADGLKKSGCVRPGTLVQVEGVRFGPHANAALGALYARWNHVHRESTATCPSRSAMASESIL